MTCCITQPVLDKAFHLRELSGLTEIDFPGGNQTAPVLLAGSGLQTAVCFNICCCCTSPGARGILWLFKRRIFIVN